MAGPKQSEGPTEGGAGDAPTASLDQDVPQATPHTGTGGDGTDATSPPPKPWWHLVAASAAVFVAIVGTSAALLVFSESVTTSIAKWIAVTIFVGYSLLTLVLFGEIVLGALSKEWSAPAMALVANDAGDGLSLSRVQALLWTSVIVFAWLYKLVLDPGEFPALPAQALLLMGISGATYLGAKSISSRAKTAPRDEGN